MSPSLGAGVAVAAGLYLLALVVLAVAARRRGSQKTLGDFYLAGRNLGVLVMLATLFATKFSAATFLGTPAEMSRIGLAAGIRAGCLSMLVVVLYLLYAPRLHRLAHKHNFVTPGDWITYRFGSSTLTLLANVVLIVTACNYLIAQLMTMGHVTAGISGGVVPYAAGVLVLALVVIVYETLGGMRAVAWTDCLQGAMMLVGVIGLLVLLVPTPAHLGEVTAALAAAAPERVAAPPWDIKRHWISMVTVMGFAAAIHPQVVQRLYAARDVATLKRAFSWMVLLPFVMTGVMFLVGIVAIAEVPGVGDADQLLPEFLAIWSSQSLLHYVLAVLVITALIAGIMSTADSLLLTLSSIIAKEIVGPTLLKGVSEETLTRAGKLLSWGILAVLVSVAISPRLTLWGMLELKAETHVQVMPLFVLGATWGRLTARAALGGLLSGCATYAALMLVGLPQIWNIHAGLIALAVNLAVCVTLALQQRRSAVSCADPAAAALRGTA